MELIIILVLVGSIGVGSAAYEDKLICNKQDQDWSFSRGCDDDK